MWFKVVPSEFLPLLRLNSFNLSPIFAKHGRVYHGNTGGDLRWLVPSPLDSYKQNQVIRFNRHTCALPV